ncbi:MAG: hypothetical protein GX096_04735 [Clostridiales bacterium]|nr:hypothetical protein [Clostridiales bacterium]
MKRLLLITLTLCLLTGNIAVGEDAAEDILTAFDGVNTLEYQLIYPDRAAQDVEIPTDENGYVGFEDLLMGGDWDIAYVYATDYDLAKLAEAVPLLDLSTQEGYQEKFDMMYPKVQEAITVDGRMVALPTRLHAAVMQLQIVDKVTDGKGNERDVRAQLGITDADLPSTFSELATFAVDYMALPRETRKGTCFNTDIGKLTSSTSIHYYADYLIDLYAHEVYDGSTPLNFDTPMFREGLDDIDRIMKAFKSDPKKNFGDNGSMCYVQSGSGSLEHDYINLRLGENQKISASLGVMVINANTQHLAEALDYLAICYRSSMLDVGTSIYDRMTYDEMLDIIIVSQLELMPYYQWDEHTMNEVQKAQETREYSGMTSPEAAQAFRENVAPYLSFTVLPRVDAYKAVKGYANGNLSADEFIAKLNALYAEALK